MKKLCLIIIIAFVVAGAVQASTSTAVVALQIARLQWREQQMIFFMHVQRQVWRRERLLYRQESRLRWQQRKQESRLRRKLLQQRRLQWRRNIKGIQMRQRVWQKERRSK